MSNKAEEYRIKAEECLARAREIADLRLRAEMESIARTWLEMAEAEELKHRLEEK